MENIYLILNERWHYEEVEETKEMTEMFENSEEVIAKIMSIKEIDVRNCLLLTEEEKRLGMIDDPGKWIAEIDRRQGSQFPFVSIDDSSVIMLKALAKFFLKIAVYRFCTVHWPKLVVCQDKIYKERIKTLKKELAHWESDFWIDTSSDKTKCNITERWRVTSHYDERKEYARRRYMGMIGMMDESSDSVQGWIDDAYEDNKNKVIYENVKELRLKYIDENRAVRRENSSDKKITEIDNIRKLLDIMERHLCGNLTQQDIVDFKENMQDWEKNIEKLSGMINSLPDFDLKETSLNE